MQRRFGRWALAVVIAATLGAAGGHEARAVSGVISGPEVITANGYLSVWSVVWCEVVFRGTLASGLVAISGEGAQIGSITSINTTACGEEVVVSLLNLPWPIRIQKLNGANPRYAVATALSSVSLRFGASMGIRVRTWSEECLVGVGTVLYSELGFESLGGSEYAGNSFSSATYHSGCPGLGYELAFELPEEEPLTLTFLPGGEIVDGLTPSPAEFGRVETGGLRQVPVTIGTTRGGRVESIAVATGRYFAVTDPNGCRGRTLSTYGTCTVNAIFSAPTESGRAVSDTLSATIGGTRYETTLRGTT